MLNVNHSSKGYSIFSYIFFELEILYFCILNVVKLLFNLAAVLGHHVPQMVKLLSFLFKSLKIPCLFPRRTDYPRVNYCSLYVRRKPSGTEEQKGKREGIVLLLRLLELGNSEENLINFLNAM